MLDLFIMQNQGMALEQSDASLSCFWGKKISTTASLSGVELSTPTVWCRDRAVVEYGNIVTTEFNLC